MRLHKVQSLSFLYYSTLCKFSFFKYKSSSWTVTSCYLHLTCKQPENMNSPGLFHLSHQLSPYPFPFLFALYKGRKRKTGSWASPDCGLHRKFLIPTSFPTASFLFRDELLFALYLLTIKHNPNSALAGMAQ